MQERRFQRSSASSDLSRFNAQIKKSKNQNDGDMPSHNYPWHSWIARKTPTLEVAGSNPVG